MNNLLNFIKISLALAVVFVLTTDLQAQVRSGKLVMEITEVKMPGMDDNPEAAMTLEMLKGSTTTLYFSPTKELMVMDLMGGMMLNRTLTDVKENKVTTYMDMMGQKMKVDMGNLESVDEDVDIQYTIDKNDRKKILGYDCYKVVVTSTAQGQTMSLETYITEDIQVMSSVIQGVQKNQLPGTILSMTLDAGGIYMVTEAIDFQETFDEKVFVIDDSGYNEMDLETLQRMGGMGF